MRLVSCPMAAGTPPDSWLRAKYLHTSHTTGHGEHSTAVQGGGGVLHRIMWRGKRAFLPTHGLGYAEHWCYHTWELPLCGRARTGGAWTSKECKAQE